MADMITTLKSALYLMLLLTIAQYSVSTRILDVLPDDAIIPPLAAAPQPADSLPVPTDPPVDPTVVPSAPVTNSGGAATPDAAPAAAATDPPPAVANAPPPTAATTDPPANALPPTAAGAATTAAITAGGDHPLTFFMHDILGGSAPSVRIVTGVVASTANNGQLPFSRPNKDIFPIQGALPLPEGTTNLINSNNVPYVAGLGGTSTTIVQSNGNSINGGNSNALPFVNAGDLPTGATLQNLLFGTTTVIDDELTEGHEIGSAVIGRAQGFYVASSQDGTSKTLLLTAVFEGGDHVGDTISFFGVHRTAAPESHIAVIGGTGKYENARGFAAVQTIHPGDQHTTDGVETLMQFNVHLS